MIACIGFAIGIPSFFFKWGGIFLLVSFPVVAFGTIMGVAGICMGWVKAVGGRNQKSGEVHQENIIVVCMRVPDGIDEAVAGIVNAQMDISGPDHFVLIQPDIYLFFFQQNKNGGERSAKALKLLDSLRLQNQRCRAMRIGEATGPLHVEFSSSGELTGMPIGEAVVQAQRLAHGAA